MFQFSRPPFDEKTFLRSKTLNQANFLVIQVAGWRELLREIWIKSKPAIQFPEVNRDWSNRQGRRTLFEERSEGVGGWSRQILG
jgi:hypothetical protein